MPTDTPPTPPAPDPGAGPGRTLLGSWMAPALLAVAAAALFALYTDNAWEDFYITFRCSKNLVEGNGLVFQPGERVHAFTSPLGVLLPAATYWVTGAKSALAALGLFRALSILCLGAAAALLWKTAERLQVGAAGRWIAVALVFTESKVVAFSINGMETGVLLFFAALLLHSLCRDPGSRGVTLATAVSFAGLMWTRPDAFVFCGAACVAMAIFVVERRSMGAWLRSVAVAVVIGGLLYLPWFAWAWWYYGSPVPHTIVAKSVYSPGVGLMGKTLLLPLRIFAGTSHANRAFTPALAELGGWPTPVLLVDRAVMIAAAFLWIAPGWNRLGRALSLAFLVGCFYLNAIPSAPWYFPIWTLLGASAVAIALADLARRGGSIRPAALALAACLVAYQAGIFGLVARQMRVKQDCIENGLRMQVGLWLREHAAPTDTVYLEPLGYIGYFSGLKMLDFPGLASPEVVREIRSGHTTDAALIGALHPDWVVLRDKQILNITSASKELDAYRYVLSWDAEPLLERHPRLPGKGMMYFDSRFTLYRRIRH